MGFLKKCYKSLFPGKFKLLIEDIKKAFDEDTLEKKQKMYIQLKKDFEELKKEKNSNSCNNNSTKKNSSDNKKKIEIVSLLFKVLEKRIAFVKLKNDFILKKDRSNESKVISNMKEMKQELENIKNSIKNANVTINSVHNSKDFLNNKLNNIIQMVTDEIEEDEGAIEQVNMFKMAKNLEMKSGGNRRRTNRTRTNRTRKLRSKK
jgi:hypothetical protein